jgi:hypothetical protein
MATKIKDQATAERAALKLNEGIEAQTKPGEPPAPREKTTSEKLFPEFMTDDGGVVNRPVKPFEDSAKPLPATATPTPEPQGQTPPATTPPPPVYLKPEELTGKMVRLKVDGIEQDVPAESLIKTNQLERHLNAQLMNLAQERKTLEDERRRLLSQPPPEVAKPGKTPEPIKKTPETEALEARILQMQQQMESLQQTMLPAIQESGIKRVEQMVKERLGGEDFRNYFSKIKDSAMAEMAKPENATNPQARGWFDSDTYYFQKYQEMKIKDLMTKPAAPANPNAPALVTSQGAPVVVNNNGQPVSIPTFEGSGGVPSRESPDASWQSTYNALFQRARDSNSQDDWMAVYRHKMSARE